MERTQHEKDDLLYNGVLIYASERDNIVDWLREYDSQSDNEFTLGDAQYENILGRAADTLLNSYREFKTTELASQAIDAALAQAKGDL